MVKQNYLKVYEANEVAVGAYLLKQGELVFNLSPTHRFNLRGENIIFGAAEVLYGLENNTLDTRLINVEAKAGSEIIKIPNPNLKKYITLYNIGFNITRVIARTVQKSNDLIDELNQKFIKENNLSKRYYLSYQKIIDAIGQQAENRKHPLAEAFVRLKSQSLGYRKGKVFLKKQSETQPIEGRQIDEFKTEFPKNSVLCRQNEPGKNLFVLNRGQIKVLLGNEEVALIEKPGSIFGEMSLFLDEPRTATLVAAKDSLVTIIGRESLQIVAERMPDFFMRITTTLWTRFKTNMEMIRELSQTNAGQAKNELKALKKELEELMRGERIFWLREYIDEIQTSI